MSTLVANSAHDYPPELIRGVAWEAARDADRVRQFLIALGLTARPDRPIPVPRNLLLTLGAGLRLLSWESQGLTLHRAAGLPAALDVIKDAILSINDPGRHDLSLPVAVLRLWVENFHWSAPEEFDADVLIDVLNSDDGVAALAELLWAVQGRNATDPLSEMCED